MNDINDSNERQSSFGQGPGMEEQHQELGGMPGSGGVRGMASKAGEKLMDTAERQKMAGADYLDGVADAVRRAAGEFGQQVPQASQYINYAADQMETFSDSLRRRDIGQMMSDLQSFARRQPTAFLGISFLAGFAAVRFLRSGPASSGSGRMRERSPAEHERHGRAQGGMSGIGDPTLGTGL